MKIRERSFILFITPILLITLAEAYVYQIMIGQIGLLGGKESFLFFVLYTIRAIELAVLIIAVAIISNSTLGPIERVAANLKEMSLGKLDIDINIKGDDEVKEIAKASERIKTSLRLIEK